MKKKIITSILLMLMYFVLTSCIACMQSTTQYADEENFIENTLKESDDQTSQSQYDTTVIYLSKEIEESAGRLLKEASFPDQDTVKKAIFKKDIKPMEVDTTWKIEREKSYRQLEKIEKDIEDQQNYIDSLLIIKKK